MKLRAQAVPYSSIVGAGVLLVDERGAARFQLAVMGVAQGVDREQSNAIVDQVVRLINANRQFDVPEKPR